jgi:glycerophosphoryl diester phosphodiesterase
MDDHRSRPLVGASPLVIGHRGASGRLPENSLAAFRGALEDGADGVELDVRLSCDGIPVVVHDATTTRTTGVRSRVADRTAAELAEMPAYGVRARRIAGPSPVPRSGETPVGIPTLDAVLNLVRPWRAVVYVELKGRRSSSGDLEGAVVQTLARHGCSNRSVVLSFNHAALRRIKQLEPGLRTAATIAPTLGVPRPSPGRVVDMVLRACADEAALHVSLATRRRIDALRTRGYTVSVWTVNSPIVAKLVTRLGVDAMMTDYPDRFARATGVSR